MGDRILRDAHDVDMFVRLLTHAKLPLTVTWQAGADRSKAQNRLMWKWAQEAAQQLGDRAPEDEQARWKLEIGVPILRADDHAFREEYDAVLRPLPYDMKLHIMKQGYPVTSRFKVRQMVAFLDEVQRQAIEAGLVLTDPDDDLSRYHQRYRVEAVA